jgi:hypothetical protein
MEGQTIDGGNLLNKKLEDMQRIHVKTMMVVMINQERKRFLIVRVRIHSL